MGCGVLFFIYTRKELDFKSESARVSLFGSVLKVRIKCVFAAVFWCKWGFGRGA